MGIYKFQDIWKTLFSWVLPVPENAHKAKCKYCPGKLIDIKCGSQALKRHEACSIHMKAVTSVAGSNIVAQMQAGTSVEEGKLKVVLLHCLKLVLDGHSLRSSDCCSRSRNFYSKLFPDSKYADINCGRTKAGYIIKFALGSYCKEHIINISALAGILLKSGNVDFFQNNFSDDLNNSDILFGSECKRESCRRQFNSSAMERASGNYPFVC